jgi:subfamily B ATP-binding cassette protein MsbA
MSGFWKILRYVKVYSTYAALNIAFNILSVIFSLVSISMVIPFLDLLFKPAPVFDGKPDLAISAASIMLTIQYYLSGIITAHGKEAALLFLCCSVVILFFLKNFFRYLGMYFIAPIRNGVVRDIRNNLYKKILSLPLSYFSNERKGDLMARATNDVQEVEWSIMSSLEVIFREPIAVASFLGAMILMSPQLTLLVLILLPITGFLVGRIGKSLKKHSLQAQNKMGVLMSVIEETLSGLRIIKAFTAEFFSTSKFGKVNNDYYRQMLKVYRKRDLSAPLSEFLGAIAMSVVMLAGGMLVLSNKIDPSVFIAYMAVFSQIISPAKSFTTAYYNVQKGLASAERINEILDAEETIREYPDAKSVAGFQHSIEYKNVSFAYLRGDNGWVLKNINITIPKGKTIALVGQSGSGKTTMADLLPRFYDPSEGDILIDGIPVKNLRIADLRKLLGVVTQESILFNDSVFNNIAFGMENVKAEEVIAAAKVANAHDFIMEMPEQYQTNIGDRGGKLSGGQRQRISIARAVLKNPPILILDEATSALDTESEKAVQDALFNLMKNRTSVVIAHRLSTIQHADEILVLQKGEIAERGTHQELLSKGGVYKKLYDLQLFV